MKYWFDIGTYCLFLGLWGWLFNLTYTPANFLFAGITFVIIAAMIFFIKEDVANVFPEEIPHDG